MNTKHYKELLDWVIQYIQSFHGLDEEIDANIKLKEKHTYLVVKHGKEIAMNHLEDESHYIMAVVSCLLHDIGRFPQFKKYRTFSDRDSFDHSLLALDTIFRQNLLKDFSKAQQVVIEKAIYFHNKLEIEESLTEEEKTICRVVRDADKIDIFRVITEFYDMPEQNRYVHVGRNLSDSPVYTDIVLERFLNKEHIDYNQVVTKSDLKLLQLGWTFELNFSTSHRIVKERDYTRKIFNHLPNNHAKDEIEKLVFG